MALLFPHAADAQNLYDNTELILSYTEKGSSKETSMDCRGVVSMDYTLTGSDGKGYIRISSGSLPVGMPPCVCKISSDDVIRAAGDFTNLLDQLAASSFKWSLRCYSNSAQGFVANNFGASTLNVSMVEQLARDVAKSSR